MELPTTPPVPPGTKVCRRCQHVLTRRDHVEDGRVVASTFEHSHGTGTDHQPEVASIAEVPDWRQRCDFCSRPQAPYVYVCADQSHTLRRTTEATVGLGAYRRLGPAAPVSARRRADGDTQVWGENWAACPDCAALIEARDLYGLVGRVTDAMPAKLTRGGKLATLRGLLLDDYAHLLGTLAPYRGVIDAVHPNGYWVEYPDKP